METTADCEFILEENSELQSVKTLKDDSKIEKLLETVQDSFAENEEWTKAIKEKSDIDFEKEATGDAILSTVKDLETIVEIDAKEIEKEASKMISETTNTEIDFSLKILDKHEGIGKTSNEKDDFSFSSKSGERKTTEDSSQEKNSKANKESKESNEEMEISNESIELSKENDKTPNQQRNSRMSKIVNKRFTISHEDESSDSENEGESEFGDNSMVVLLRNTISELERALKDSRALIATRDETIASLRKEIEKGREHIHREQMKWQRKCAVVEDRKREIQDLSKKLENSEKNVEELSERIKEFESPYSESDEIVACCSSMKELLELKMELVEKNEIIKEIQRNNPSLGNAIVLTKKANETREKESEQHNQLKLKFLRDAFFYFMIDFHSDEQIKAILAVLCYGDQREDVIYQAYRMRQQGKKFAVKEVSSRGLAFLHEES